MNRYVIAIGGAGGVAGVGGVVGVEGSVLRFDILGIGPTRRYHSEECKGGIVLDVLLDYYTASKATRREIRTTAAKAKDCVNTASRAND